MLSLYFLYVISRKPGLELTDPVTELDLCTVQVAIARISDEVSVNSGLKSRFIPT